MKLRTQTTFPSTSIGTNTATALVPHQDKASLAPVAAESQALSAPDLAPAQGAARRGRTAATFGAGLLIGVIGAVPATGWVMLRASARPALTSFAWPGARAEAPAAAAKIPPVTSSPPPPPTDVAPRPSELACIRDWAPPCRETAAVGLPVALGTKAPARAKGRRIKKPHGEAVAAATTPATGPQGAPAQGAAPPPVVEAARALIDHQAETELSDALK
ncbi:MAG: hypothetical protein JOZ69_10205 [Myxococcales bacterium]|nr:hypothetical protein [Myxococcales bacterium]